MLRVKTKIGVSKIHGIGIFADEFIPKNTIVWEFNNICDRMYTEDEFNSADKLFKEYLKTYAFKFCNQYCLCNDDARFFNHSETPNCYSSDFNENVLGCTRALTDINIGDELTDNYNQFGFTDLDNEWNKINK